MLSGAYDSVGLGFDVTAGEFGGVEGGCRGGRCLVLLVFRPDEEGVVEKVQRRLQALHAQSPGAHVMLVCTRWESPAEGTGLEEHRQEVRAVLEEVEDGALSMLE
eukprot:3693113-Rhodomonas_salina.1